MAPPEEWPAKQPGPNPAKPRKAALYAVPGRKPNVLSPDFDGIPAEMKSAPRWVLWRLVWKPKDKRWTKVPFGKDGRAAKSNDPTTWTTFATVLSAYRAGRFDGVGFMLGDGFVGIDLDDVRDPDTGKMAAEAEELVKAMGTHAEVSPSGTGVKMIGRGDWRAEWHRKPFAGTGEIEGYSAGRYFTVTGRAIGSHSVTDIQAAIDELGRRAVLRVEVAKSVNPVPAMDDEELIRRAESAANGGKFKKLWEGDTSDHGGDESRADLALAGMLAFWCGGDAARTDRMFRQSKLMRGKWDEKRGLQTYGQRTIAKALEGKTEFYSRSQSQSTPTPTTDAAVWPDPITLRAEFDPSPFPVDVLPSWMQNYVVALAEEKQVPVDLPAMLVLGASAAGIARKVVVTPWKGWDREPTNLFTMCCLPPGERKSQTFSAVFAPVKDLEADLREREEPRVREAESLFRVAQKRVDFLEGKIAKESEPVERAKLTDELKTAREELRSIVVPALPLLRVDDDTPEMMALELVKQGGRLLAASPEARTLENIDRYSDKPNFDVFLKAHAGDDIRSGRIGRGRDSVDRPALTCVYTPQPCVLEALGETPEMHGRGFLARWFFSLPQSRIGFRKARAGVVRESVYRAYEAAMLALWGVGYAGEEESHELKFSPDAVAALVAFEEWKEVRLREGEELAGCAGWGNKLGGLCVRLCGILHAADGVLVGEGWKATPIQADVVLRAVRLCRDYAVPHALAAFDRMGASETMIGARAILKWLGKRSDPFIEFSKRDVFNGCRGAFQTVDEMQPAIGLLEQHYLIRLKTEPQMHAGPGRKRSPVFEVNPTAFNAGTFAHNTHNAHKGGDGFDAFDSAESANSANRVNIPKNTEEDASTDFPFGANGPNNPNCDGLFPNPCGLPD